MKMYLMRKIMNKYAMETIISVDGDLYQKLHNPLIPS